MNELKDEVIEVISVNDSRSKLVEKVRQWGGSTSDALLDSTCRTFSVPNIYGFIGYRVEFGCAVVFGDPVCSPVDTSELVHAFQQFCKEQGWVFVYLTVSESFAKWALEKGGGVLLEFGEELVIDPRNDPRNKEGTKGSLVRRKVRHALAEGVITKEYNSSEANPSLEAAIEKVGSSWLKGRAGPQIYISHVRLFEDRLGKRWFYAQKGEQIVGVLLLNQLQAQQGWLLNHLMFTADAPGGTPESLVVTALETLAKEGCHFVTFGSIPLAQLGEITGPSKPVKWLIEKSFKIFNRFFHLSGKRGFWEKFHPESKRSYLVFSQPRIGLRAVVGLMRALNVRL